MSRRLWKHRITDIIDSIKKIIVQIRGKAKVGGLKIRHRIYAPEHLVSMPRLARLEAPGVLHHVMGRGIERKKIFTNDTDRNDFIDRLAGLAEEGAMDVYAWVLQAAADGM